MHSFPKPSFTCNYKLNTERTALRNWRDINRDDSFRSGRPTGCWLRRGTLPALAHRNVVPTITRCIYSSAAVFVGLWAEFSV